MPVWLFQTINGLPCDAQGIVMPLSQWHEAANWEQFTDQPRKV